MSGCRADQIIVLRDGQIDAVGSLNEVLHMLADMQVFCDDPPSVGRQPGMLL